MLKKLNTYLLENYPSLWNLKVVPVFITAVIIHLLFFTIGALTYADDYYALADYSSIESSFGENGLWAVSVILSILVVLVWLINMFKNNAFKNFLPLGKLHLFQHFCIFFILFFLNTSYYISYYLGANFTIRNQTPKEEFIKDVQAYNNASIFLMHHPNNYEFFERTHPAPFPFHVESERLEYADETYEYNNTTETGIDTVSDTNKKEHPNDPKIIPYYVQYASKQYRFYKWDIEQLRKDKNFKVSLYNEDQEDEETYSGGYSYEQYPMYNHLIGTDGKKYTVRSKQYRHHLPEYYKVYYEPDSLFQFYEPSFYNYRNIPFLAEDTRSKEEIYDLWLDWLDNNKRDDIKTALESFFELKKKYHYTTDLIVDTWLDRIPEDTKIQTFILRNKPSSYDGEYDDYYDSYYGSETYKYPYKNYINTNDADNIFSQIQEAHEQWIEPMMFAIFMWVAFALSILLLIFRTTNIRNIIFSAVTGGVLLLIIGLFATVARYESEVHFAVSYMVIYGFILMFSIISKTTLANHKTLAAISHTISLVGFIPCLIAFILCLDDWTEYKVIDENGYSDYVNPQWYYTLMDTAVWWLFVFGFLIVLYYTMKIKVWRASPEG